MNLYDRQQVRRLRQRVRQLVRASPELKKFVPQQKARPALLRFFLGRGFLALCFAGWMTQVRMIAGEPAIQGALLLWCLNSVCWRAHALQTGLIFDHGWTVLHLLPASEQATLRWFLQRHWLGAAGLAMDCALFYLVWFVPELPTWQTAVGAVLFGILHGLAATLVAQLLVARFYGLPSALAGGVTFLGCVAFWASGRSELLAQAATQAGSVLKWISPGGWIHDAFRAGWIGGEPTAWLGLLPLGLLALLLPWSRGALLPYHAARPVEPDRPGAFPESEQLASAALAPAPTAIGPTATADLVRTRTFLPELKWDQAGPLERLTTRLFTARDRHLATFLDQAMPRPTASLIAATKAFAVVALLSLVTAQLIPAVTVFVLCGGATLVLRALPWPGVSGVSFPTGDATVINKVHTRFPLTPRELMRLGWKISLVRLVAGLPLLAGFGAWTAWMMRWPVPDGAWVGGKVAVLCFALHPLAFTVACEGGSVSKRRLGVWLVVPTLLLVGLVLIVVVLFIPFLPNEPKPAILAMPLIALVLARVVFELYDLGWKRCWFDSDRVS